MFLKQYFITNVTNIVSKDLLCRNLQIALISFLFLQINV